MDSGVCRQCDTRGRWLAMVCHGVGDPAVRRRNPFFGCGSRWNRCDSKHPAVHRTKTIYRTQASLPHRTALLGHAASTGPVFVSVGSHDDGLRGGNVAIAVLSHASHRPAILRAEHRGIAHSAGDALPQRCGSRRIDRNRAGLSGLLRVPVKSTNAQPLISIEMRGDSMRKNPGKCTGCKSNGPTCLLWMRTDCIVCS